MLAVDAVAAWQIAKVCASCKPVRLDFTGNGYFLILGAGGLPVERLLLDSPIVNGKVGGLLTGFIAIVERSELRLECFAYREDIVPDIFRDLGVVVFVDAA